MRSTNQRCNALASVIGIFLHSCNAPERVVELLSSVGLSISPTGINDSITALSKEARSFRIALGRTLTAAFGFDNFDVYFTSSVPTLENAGGKTLAHLTSGTMIPLAHGVTRDDLKCSQYLWQMSAHNLDNLRDEHPTFLDKTIFDLHGLYPDNVFGPSNLPVRTLRSARGRRKAGELAAQASNVQSVHGATSHPPAAASARPPHSESESAPQAESGALKLTSLTRHQRFAVWKTLQALVEDGPQYFRQFRMRLKEYEPEAVEEPVPVVKTEQRPAQAMNISEATPHGCGRVIEHLLRDAGIYDPDEKDEHGQPRMHVDVDISDYVIIIHGDMATLAHIQSLLDSRAIEATPWRRFQFVVLVPGAFHILMACADAVWKVHAKPTEARKDPCSAYKHAEFFYPKDSGKFGSNPSFRMMHDFIKHDFTARILECWSIEAESKVKSSDAAAILDDWAKKNAPSFEHLVETAVQIVTKYVALGMLNRDPDATKRDASFENNQLRLRDYLLYEETHFAMNHGDVARFETCILNWIYVWRATGKHPYAKQMTRFLLELHYMYPDRLKYVPSSPVRDS